MDLASYLIIGVVVSALVQYLKTKFETNSAMTLLLVAGISVIAGTFYFFIKQTSLLQPILEILAFAGAVYTYIIKRFESKDEEY